MRYELALGVGNGGFARRSFVALRESEAPGRSRKHLEFSVAKASAEAHARPRTSQKALDAPSCPLKQLEASEPLGDAAILRLGTPKLYQWSGVRRTT